MYLLTALLALSTGWIWGHTTARVVHIPIGGRRAEDEAALTDDEQLRFRAITRYFDDTDIPDDPESRAA